MYRYLSGLALQDADLAGVVRLISDRTAATVAVLTQLMDVLTAAAPGVTAEKAAADVRAYLVHPRLGQVLRASRLSQRALRLPKVGGMPAVIVAPIQVGDEVPSYLVTVDPAENLSGEDMSLLVTEHAATICGVILGRERVVAAASRRVRDDLVEGLLLPRDAARRWAASGTMARGPCGDLVSTPAPLPPRSAGDRVRARAVLRRPTCSAKLSAAPTPTRHTAAPSLDTRSSGPGHLRRRRAHPGRRGLARVAATLPLPIARSACTIGSQRCTDRGLIDASVPASTHRRGRSWPRPPSPRRRPHPPGRGVPAVAVATVLSAAAGGPGRPGAPSAHSAC